jgi:hypothetical protein
MDSQCVHRSHFTVISVIRRAASVHPPEHDQNRSVQPPCCMRVACVLPRVAWRVALPPYTPLRATRGVRPHPVGFGLTPVASSWTIYFLTQLNPMRRARRSAVVLNVYLPDLE